MIGNPEDVAQRLRSAIGPLSFVQIGRRTGFHPETVRRHLSGRGLSVEFLAVACREFGIDADWALLGRGPGPKGPTLDDWLGEVTFSEVMTALAHRLAQLERQVASSPSSSSKTDGPMVEHSAAPVGQGQES
ncbi:MAG: hypothetical protein AAGI30_05530 [Planctomycetota bacterium]